MGAMEEECANERLKDIFRKWDHDGSGLISREELKMVLRRLDAGLTEDKLDTLFDLADQNADGVLQYSEFVEFLCSGKPVKATPQKLFVWMRGEVSWSCTLEPARRVTKLTVGPHSAFALLSDGACWRIGPRARNSDACFEEPLALTAIQEACGGEVQHLGIDFTTLFAVGADGVWLQDSPGESEQGHALAAALALCDDDAPDSFSLPVRAPRLDDFDVREVLGDRSWGLVSTVTGTLMYLDASSRDCLGGHLVVDCSSEQEPPERSLVGVSFEGGAHATSMALAGRSQGAVFVLQGGRVAAFGPIAGSLSARLDANSLAVPLVSGLSNIVSVTSNCAAALDASGALWSLAAIARTGSAQRMPVLGASGVVRRLGGEVAILAAPYGEEAFAIGMEAAGSWAVGLRSFSAARSGDGFGVACAAGAIITEDMAEAAFRADFWAHGAANELAWRNGRPLLPEQGSDLARLEELLEDGCDPNAVLGDEPPLLLCYARRAAKGEPSMPAAMQVLLRFGVAHAEAVSAAALAGDAATVAALRDAGVPVPEDLVVGR